jgi:hypothetical protein
MSTMNQDQQEPKKDKRKGNSGRKPAEDPRIGLSIYILASEIKALGGKKKFFQFVYKTVKKEAAARQLKKMLAKAEKLKSSSLK